MADNAQQLIAARGVQGVGAALLVPGSLALISAAYPQEERGAAIGTWSGFSGITAALGPVLGGFLVDRYSWAWAFLLNVPLAMVVLVIAWRHIPESRSVAARAGLDGWGALLATLALGAVVYTLIEAPAQGWSAAVVLAALAISVALMALFVLVEQHSRTPMVPLTLFRSRNFSGANLLTLLLYAALGGGLFYVPLNLIQVQGYSATAAGATLLPFILIMFILSGWAGQLVDRVGSKLPLVVGPGIAAAGFALFAVPGVGGSYWVTFFPAIVVLGLGMTITVAPLTTTVMNAVGSDRAGIASGVNNAVSRTAALLAIAVFGMVMAWAFSASLADKLAVLQVPGDFAAAVQVQAAKLAAITLPPQLDEATTATLQRAVSESFVTGFRWVMLLSAALALVSALCAWVLIEGKQLAVPVST